MKNHLNFFISVKRVVNLLEKIVDKKHQKTDDIHLIGFSLGAHLMGRTGKTMKDAKKEVGRITGKTIKKYHLGQNV